MGASRPRPPPWPWPATTAGTSWSRSPTAWPPGASGCRLSSPACGPWRSSSWIVPLEAKALLYQLAKRDLADQRRDPGNLIQLGELFAATGDYDLAIRLMRKAGSMSPYGVDDRRILQLSLDRELATSYRSWQSAHFEIRYPRETGEKYAQQLTNVLVAERQRLRRWIPVAADDGSIEVALFPLLRFMSVYGGGIDVVGIYDGKVRVPFADLRSLDPYLVRILTHELAHAMIAEMTHDQAPHWFQEGLAQHVEMGTGPINPIPDLYRTSHILAFPMIDPILKGFSEPQLVELAYSESVWAIHFIESRFGVGALHKMLRAFAEGSTTEAALQQVLGMTESEFDRAAWGWCREQGPTAWTTKERRYDLEYNSLIERRATAETTEEAPPLPVGHPDAAGPSPALATWYRAYTTRADPVKRALAAMLPQLRADLPISPADCGRFSSRVRALLEDPTALAAPDERANRQLHFAYGSFADLAEACRAGDLALARDHLSRAEEALGRAAAALARYGLKP